MRIRGCLLFQLWSSRHKLDVSQPLFYKRSNHRPSLPIEETLTEAESLPEGMSPREVFRLEGRRTFCDVASGCLVLCQSTGPSGHDDELSSLPAYHASELLRFDAQECPVMACWLLFVV